MDCVPVVHQGRRSRGGLRSRQKGGSNVGFQIIILAYNEAINGSGREEKEDDNDDELMIDGVKEESSISERKPKVLIFKKNNS